MSRNSDERMKRTFDDSRETRAVEDRAITENREISDDDRFRFFQNAFSNSVLPDLPPIPGYKIVWLTTNNRADPIHRRELMGYVPVKAEDVPGWEAFSVKSGEMAGVISVNEMVAYKIPLPLWNRFMAENHHNAPNREGEKVTVAVDEMKDRAKSYGARLDVGEGYQDVRNERLRANPFT